VQPRGPFCFRDRNVHGRGAHKFAIRTRRVAKAPDI
jgi:hypothetical protein